MAKNRANIILFLLPTIILFLLIYAASLVILLGTSFTRWGIGVKLTFIGITNFIEMFTGNNDFKQSFINNTVWIILQSTLNVTIGVVFALIISKKEFYWKFARTVYMIPSVISGAAMGMLFLFILNPEFGAVNNIIRMLGFKDFSQNWFMDYSTAFLTVTMTWLPYAAIVSIMVFAEIAAIPETVLESAKIDGADELEKNIYIIIPMLRNIIGTCVILSATAMIKKFELIMMTTGGGPGNITMSVPMHIYKSALMDNNFGYANAVGVFLVIYGITIILLIRRLFRIGESYA